jgi:hypothetical protein
VSLSGSLPHERPRSRSRGRSLFGVIPSPSARAPDFGPPAGRRTAERPPDPDFGGRPPRRPDPHDPVDPEVLPRTPSLGELLSEITEARARRRAGYGVDGTPRAGSPRRGLVFPFAGCLIRALGLGFLLFLAFIIFLVLLFGGFLVN